MRRITGLSILLCLTILSWSAGAQSVTQSRGVDSRIDYPELARCGPWDDRNYLLTLDDLAWLAPDEAELAIAVPAFYRVHLRQTRPELRRSGALQYPRSAVASIWCSTAATWSMASSIGKFEERAGSTS